MKNEDPAHKSRGRKPKAKVILASQSPRRKELLDMMGMDYSVIPSQFDEQLDDSRDPEEVAIELAIGKAFDVAEHHPEALVIGADTIVSVDGEQLGKPATIEEAHAMLQRLADRPHSVITSIALVRKADDLVIVGVDTTTVYCKPYDSKAVETYLATRDSLDKAGGYGIQSGAAPLIDHIEGHYDTVVGLPTYLLATLLEQVGITAEPASLPPPVEQILH